MSLIDIAKAIVVGAFFILLGALSLLAPSEYAILWPWVGVAAILVGVLAIVGAIVSMVKR